MRRSISAPAASIATPVTAAANGPVKVATESLRAGRQHQKGEQVALVDRFLRGPDPDCSEPAAWIPLDLYRFIEARSGKTTPQSMPRLVRRLSLSRQWARSV